MELNHTVRGLKVAPHSSSLTECHAYEPVSAVMPNNSGVAFSFYSFKRTGYGKRRKTGLRHMVHHLIPGFRRLRPLRGPVNSNVSCH